MVTRVPNKISKNDSEKEAEARISVTEKTG